MFAYLISGLLVFTSINGNISGSAKFFPFPEEVKGNHGNNAPSDFQGLYNGYFGQSAIEIFLDKVEENGTASGYSLHKGLKRPLNGTWEKVSDSTKVRFLLHEPGDNKFDGHFDLLIDSVTFEGEGLWYPKPNSGLGEVFVTLKKQ
jgi:hypothetical protein